jgi:hypothetical protein
MRSGGHRSRSSTNTTIRPVSPTRLTIISSKSVVNSSRTVTRSRSGEGLIKLVRSTFTRSLTARIYGLSNRNQPSTVLVRAPTPVAAACPEDDSSCAKGPR